MRSIYQHLASTMFLPPLIDSTSRSTSMVILIFPSVSIRVHPWPIPLFSGKAAGPFVVLIHDAGPKTRNLTPEDTFFGPAFLASSVYIA